MGLQGKLLIALAAACIAFSSCNSSMAVQQEHGALTPGPGPVGQDSFVDLQTLPQRIASASGLQKSGSEYETGLPSQNVTQINERAYFSPQGWTLPESAFAIYHFDLTGHSGDETMLFEWNGTWDFTTDPQNFYIGMPDWGQGHWVWFAADSADSHFFSDISPFIRLGDGTCYMALVFLGDGNPDLIRLGFREAPVVNSVSPLGVIEGLQTNISADVDGTEPFDYLWEFGEGATPSTSIDASPLITPGTAGEYACRLTVTNIMGQDVFPFNLVVQQAGGDWAHTFGNSASETDERVVKCRIGPDGNLNLAGSYLSSGVILLARLSPDGVMTAHREYSINVDVGSEYIVNAMELDSLGNIFVCGRYGGDIQTNPDGVFIGKFDATTLAVQWFKLWNKEILGDYDSEVASAVALDDEDNAYILGWTRSYGITTSAAFIMKFGGDGSLLWQRGWETPYDENVGDLAISGSSVYAACVSKEILASPPWAVYHPYVIEYNKQGVFQRLSDMDGSVITGMSTDNSGNIFVTQKYGTTSSITKLSSTLDVLWSKRIWADNSTWLEDIAIAPDGRIFTAGAYYLDVFPNFSNHAVIGEFSSSGEMISMSKWNLSPEGSSSLYSVVMASSGILILAGGSETAGGSWVDVSGDYSVTDEPAPGYTLSIEEVEINHPADDHTLTDTSWEYVIDTGSGKEDLFICQVTP